VARRASGTVPPPTGPPARAAILTATAALADRHVVLKRRHQEAVAAARAICHTSRQSLARVRVARQRRQGQQVGPLAWFAVQGIIDEQVVRAVWTDGQLTCDRPLRCRAKLLVDLGAQFDCDDPPRRFLASLQAPPIAVLLTLIRACDLATMIEVDLGASHPPTTSATQLPHSSLQRGGHDDLATQQGTVSRYGRRRGDHVIQDWRLTWW
jgi:hypothetical protein